MSLKPVIVYVDDEPHNLTVFEASLPSDWEIKTFSNPLHALEALEKLAPWVLISDQRMPGITGVKFLELAKKIHPHAVRIIVTGYSDEDLVVDSVRKAQIFDYIRKPWEPDELEASLRRSVEYYRANEEARVLHQQLVEREALLERQNKELVAVTTELKASSGRETDLRKELECWVPPFLLNGLKNNTMKFPMKRDLVGIAFDIVGSANLHGVTVKGRSIRSLVIHAFSEAVLRHGGWRESMSGDSAYAHFGLGDVVENPAEAALSAAREFRESLRSLSEIHGKEVHCGIALHVAREALVDIHHVQLTSVDGTIVQKSFDTTSMDVDLLHRMEKIVHELPGSNIIISEDFVQALKKSPMGAIALGTHVLKGQSKPATLHLIPAFGVTSPMVDALKVKLTPPADPTKKAA